MSIAAEDQLLLALARVAPGPDVLDRGRQLAADPFDWNVVVEMAIRHGVAPLVDRSLEQCLPPDADNDPVPARARAELRRLGEVSARRNHRLLGVTAEIVRALQDRGVEALALKDVGLAIEAYPEPGLRPLGDIDLLIRRSDYVATAAVMAELGFGPLPRAEIPFTLRYAWAHHFHRPEGNVWVDMQWGVMQREWSEPGATRRSFDAEDLWRDSRTLPVTELDTPIHVPSREAALFHLCGHLEGHGYGELVLFSDIAVAIDAWGAELDWDRVARLAEHYEARATVYHVLLLCRELVGARVSDDVLGLFSDDVFRGSLYGPIFGGLTSLHLALDEIVDAADPPAPLLARLERDVRGQAARARALYDELDAVLAAYIRAGGDLLVLEGQGEARRFPDDALAEFGEVHVLVPAQQTQRLRDAFAERGWRASTRSELEVELAVQPDEEVLASKAISVKLGARHVAGLSELLGSEIEPTSNREAALASVRVRLRRNAKAGRCADPTIVIASLDNEQLLAWLLVRLGSIEHEVLFGLPQVRDFLRLRAGEIDGSRVVMQAAGIGAQAALARGLAITAQLIPTEPRLRSVAEALTGSLPAPRALEWGREGPAGLERHRELRAAYLYLLCVLTACSHERRQLLRSGLQRRGERPAPLLEILRDASRGLRTVLLRRAVNARETVYWLEA